jgi:hypothetical protein
MTGRIRRSPGRCACVGCGRGASGARRAATPAEFAMIDHPPHKRPYAAFRIGPLMRRA